MYSVRNKSELVFWLKMCTLDYIFIMRESEFRVRCRSIKAGLNLAVGFHLTVQRRFFFFFFFFFLLRFFYVHASMASHAAFVLSLLASISSVGAVLLRM